MSNKDIWVGVVFIFIGVLVLVRPSIIFWFVGIGFIVMGILHLARKR